MATRSRTSFQKRQKEIARMEKQRDKAAKRSQRKLNPSDTVDNDSEYLLDADGLPVLGEDGAPIRLMVEGDGEGDGDDADAEDQDESQTNNN
ncbi:MAG: hypothetical protein ABI806_05705 [Candidatus Solibacter sp.]